MSAHVTERLGLFLDGEIPADERAAIASHLRDCGACAKRLEELAAVDDVARSLTVEAPEGYFDDFPSRVRKRLKAPSKRRVGPPVWSFAAAAALLLGVLTPLVWRQMQTPPAAPAEREVAPAAPPPQVGTLAPAPPRPPSSAVVHESLRSEGEEAKAKTTPLKDAKAAPSLEGRAARGDEGSSGSLAKKAQTPESAAAPRAKEETEVRRDAPEPAPGAAGFAAAPGESREADSLQAQSPAPLRRAEGVQGKSRSAVAANAAPAEGAAEVRYRALLARRAWTVAEARALREAWSAFAQSDPAGPHADEARVRTIEAGAAAYRLSGEADDRAAMERDAAEYLARPDAQQAPRVRALVASVKPN